METSPHSPNSSAIGDGPGCSPNSINEADDYNHNKREPDADAIKMFVGQVSCVDLFVLITLIIIHGFLVKYLFRQFFKQLLTFYAGTKDNGGVGIKRNVL